MTSATSASSSFRKLSQQKRKMTTTPTPSCSSSSSLASLYKKEIDNFNRCEKFISRNRYVADPAYDMSEHWPVWPKNLYFTATPSVPSPLEIPQGYFSDSLNFFDGDYHQQAEPEQKRLRCSPVPPLRSNPVPDRGLSEWDCELLFHFCDLVDDEQTFLTETTLSSDSFHEDY
jgi:hypothetical protein